jgi:hypothetical protein
MFKFEIPFLLLGFLAISCSANRNKAPTVTIDAGIVVGKTTTLPAALAPVNQFLGIPFAQSPPERFSPPKRPSRSLKPINATEWKPACIQQFRCRSNRDQVSSTIVIDLRRSANKLAVHSICFQHTCSRRVRRLPVPKRLCPFNDPCEWWRQGSAVLDLWWLTSIR